MNGTIAWFGNNPVAANLVMVFIIVSGLVASTSISCCGRGPTAAAFG